MQFIDQSDQIQKVLEEVQSEKHLALDTEFVWTKTFYPIPALLQLATPEQIYLIDLLAENFPKESLKKLLENSAVEKILHSPDQDLRVFYLFCQAHTKNIFDTQLAYAFAGHAKQVSLAKMLLECKSIEISKSQQVSDWTLRPLSEKQLSYAAEDVAHLIDIRHLLAERIKEKYDWFEEDNLTNSEDANIYNDLDTDKAYRKIKGYGKLKLRSVFYLQKIAAYRIEQAQSSNITPNFILHKDLLYKAAYYLSTDYGDFTRNGFTERQLRRHYKVLSAIGKAVSITKDEDLPQDLIKPMINSTEKKLGNQLCEVVDQVAEENQLDANLFYSRSEIRQFAVEHLRNEKKQTLKGWRKNLLEDKFSKILSE